MLSVDKSYQDLYELHSFMSKKRKGVESIKFKSKLPSNSVKSGNRNPFGKPKSNYLNNSGDFAKMTQERKRQQQKVEAYLNHLLKVVLKHNNQLYKKKLYSFISSHH